MNKKKLSDLLIPCSIFIITLAIRLYRLKVNEVFISNDEVNTFLATLDLFHVFDNLSLGSIIYCIFRLYAFPYSWVLIAFNFLMISFMSIFHIPLTEYTLTFPMVVVTSLSVIIVYYIGKELCSKQTGIMSAIVIAILPLHVGISRVNLGPTGLGSTFLMLTVFLFIKYLKSDGVKFGWLTSLAFGIYLGSEHSFLGIFPVILYAAFIFEENDLPFKEKIMNIRRKLLNKQILLMPAILVLPMLIVWLYFVSRGHPTGGHIGHMFAKAKDYRFHPVALQNIVYSCGILLASFLPVAFLFGLWKTIKFKKEGILFIWSIIYLFPWFFLVIHGNAHRLYYMEGLIPLIILAVYMILSAADFIRKKYLELTGRLFKYAVFIAIIFFTLSMTLKYVFDFEISWMPLVKRGFLSDLIPNPFSNPDYLETGYFNGSVIKPNWGCKTAGYYIRENTTLSVKIFTELATPNAKYYFHRKIYNSPELWHYFSADFETKLKVLAEVINAISLIVIKPYHAKLAEQYMGDSFHRIVDIFSGDKNVLCIYSREKKQHQIMRTEEYDSLFDKKYGNWESLYVEDWIYRPGFY